MAIKRNKKDYGYNEKSHPVFLRIMDPKTGRNKILGWFPSKAAAKKKVFNILDANNQQHFTPSNYGRAWSMRPAREVEDSKYPFGYQYDVQYHVAYEDMKFYDRFAKIQDESHIY